MNKLGQNVSLSDDAVLGRGITIGNNVTVYPGVNIADECRIFDGAVLGRPPLSAGNTTRPLHQSLSSLTIGPGTVIGANAVLYAGSRMGAIVAPSAMVTRDVPPWTVVAGVPARPIRAVDPMERNRVLAHFGLDRVRAAG